MVIAGLGMFTVGRFMIKDMKRAAAQVLRLQENSKNVKISEENAKLISKDFAGKALIYGSGFCILSGLFGASATVYQLEITSVGWLWLWLWWWMWLWVWMCVWKWMGESEREIWGGWEKGGERWAERKRE